MATEIIAFYSSDARELYKADVFRSLALPKGYVIHFRYRSDYVHNDLLVDLQSLTGKEGVVFYASGNDLSVDAEKRSITLHSIRKVVIKSVVRDQNIDLIHFYLSLDDLYDCEPQVGTSKSLLPPYHSVSKISIEPRPNHLWINRVESVLGDFGDTLFYLISGVSQNGRPLSPTYSDVDKASYYSLSDESAYEIQISFFDASGGRSVLSAENTNDVVDLVIQEGRRLGTPRDTVTYKLYTNSLNRQQTIALSRLRGSTSLVTGGDSPTPLDLSVELTWHVSRGRWKTWQFGLLSALAAIGLLGLGMANDDLSGITFQPMNLFIGGVSILLIGVAAGNLFRIFNKK